MIAKLHAGEIENYCGGRRRSKMLAMVENK